MPAVLIPTHWSPGEAHAALDFLHDIFLAILDLHGDAIRHQLRRDSPLYTDEHLLDEDIPF